MKNLSRRRFIALGSVGMATVPLSSFLNSATAADLPMLDPASAGATGLQYAETTPKEGQTCENCMHYKADAGAAAGTCPFFQGSLVGKDAWCVAWAVKS